MGCVQSSPTPWRDPFQSSHRSGKLWRGIKLTASRLKSRTPEPSTILAPVPTTLVVSDAADPSSPAPDRTGKVVASTPFDLAALARDPDDAWLVEKFAPLHEIDKNGTPAQLLRTAMAECLMAFRDGDLPWEFHAHSFVSYSASHLGSFGLALSHVRRMLEIADELDDADLKYRAYRTLCLLHDRLGCPTELLDCARKLYALVEVIAKLEEENKIPKYRKRGLARKMSAIRTLAFGYIGNDLPRKALELYQNTTDYFIYNEDYDNLSIVLSQIGNIYDSLRDYDMAVQQYQASITILEKIPERPPFFAIPHANMGRSLIRLKRFEEAAKSLDIARSVSEKRGDLFVLGRVFNSYAEMHRKLGDFDRALEFAAMGWFYSDQTHDLEGFAICALTRAKISIATAQLLGKGNETVPHYERALNYLSESLSVFLKLNRKRELLRIYHHFTVTYEALGRSEDAERSRCMKLQLMEEVNEVCPICLSQIGDGVDEVQGLRCSHFFHAKCLSKWFESHCTCPECRQLTGGTVWRKSMGFVSVS